MAKLTEAEKLLHLVEKLGGRYTLVHVEDIDGNGWEVAKIAVALSFSRKPKAFQFRAIMEAWDNQRIVSEMY